MADTATIETAVREFLTENFPLSGDAHGLGADESLIGAGVIDSTGVLEVIGFIEERWEIAIADEEVLPENLDSIASIGRFVSRKLGAENGSSG
jgi:acyl carrier protein